MRFEKVSFEQFYYDYCYANGVKDLTQEKVDNLREVWSNIKLPMAGTSRSAGRDFYMPYTVMFTPGQYALIPTGIRFKCDDDKFLHCLPRSGLGFKYGMRLRNTAGIIDADYYESDNEGHIMAKVTVEEPVCLEAGTAFMQGIITQYFKAEDDVKDAQRNGGFGSTGM